MLLGPSLGGLAALACRGVRACTAFAMAGSLVALASAGMLLTGSELPLYPSLPWAPEIGLSLALRVDFVTVGLAAMVSFVGAVILQYAAVYFGPTEKGRRAIATLALFEAAMLGLVLSDDVLLLFVFWELTGLCSFFLIRTDERERADAFGAAKQALLVTGAGALPMLIGFLLLADFGGSTRLSELVHAPLSTTEQTIVLALVLPGVLTKSAQWPLHFWLPGAMAAPTPISAFLHSATMVKAGVILLLFLQPIVAGSPLWSALLVPLGATTCIWGAYQALTQDDIKLLMAWSTVSQLGLLTLTAGLGTDLAARAVLLHLFAHAIFKAGLFLTVGAVDHSVHTRSLARLGGVRRVSPVLFLIAIVLGGSMMGLPPFAGFLSKELMLEKAMLAHPVVHAVAIAGIALGSVGTVAYTLRFVLGTFCGPARSGDSPPAHGPGIGLLAGPAILALVTLGAGLAAPWTDAWLLEPASEALLGAPLEAPGLALWHGITPALLWSAGIVASGVALVRALRGRPMRSVVPLDAADQFEAAMAGAQRLGRLLAKLFASLNPNVYFAAVVVLGFGLAVPLVGWVPRLPRNVDVPAAVALGLLVLLLALLLRLPGRLTRVLTMGLVGAVVAILFRMLQAPDLMLTQLLVEVLMTVFLALSLRLLVRHGAAPPKPMAARLGQMAVALVAGLGAAGLAALLLATDRDTRLLDFYAEAAPRIAQGKNLVNVILVDFRSLDTLVETLVVLLAALGVGGLLFGRELPDRELPDREAPNASPPVGGQR